VLADNFHRLQAYFSHRYRHAAESLIFKLSSNNTV
jgi:hypothetical protein